MRDPDRIHRILAALHDLWKRNPDLRLGQIIVTATNKAGRKTICPEIFYMEDDTFLSGIEKFYLEPPKSPATSTVVDHSLSERFWSGEAIEGVLFKHNQSVRIISGEHVGSVGSIITVRRLNPEPIFLVEKSDGFDVHVKQSDLESL